MVPLKIDTQARRGVASLIVPRCVIRALIVCALCCAIGPQWLALQSLAWTKMIIDNSKSCSLGQAISQTFDGSHPCSLCHLVQEGKKSEKKPDTATPAGKIDLICLIRTGSMTRPFAWLGHSDTLVAALGRPDAPPTPPPRLLGWS
jgi:hypothetical protein